MNLAIKCNGDGGIYMLFCVLLAFSLKGGLRKVVGENEFVYLHDVVVHAKNDKSIKAFVLRGIPT